MKYTLHFAVTCPDLEEGDHLFLTGSVEELGHWAPKRALKLKANEKGFVFTLREFLMTLISGFTRPR